MQQDYENDNDEIVATVARVKKDEVDDIIEAELEAELEAEE